MVKLGGICGSCGKYYSGQSCPKCVYIEVESVPGVIMDFHDEYYDHGLGEVVKSRQHRNQLMKEKGLIEVGNEWKYIDPERQRANKEKEMDKRMETVRGQALRVLGG